LRTASLGVWGLRVKSTERSFPPLQKDITNLFKLNNLIFF